MFIFHLAQTELSHNLQQLSEKARSTTEFIQRLKGMSDKVTVIKNIQIIFLSPSLSLSLCLPFRLKLQGKSVFSISIWHNLWCDIAYILCKCVYIKILIGVCLCVIRSPVMNLSNW